MYTDKEFISIFHNLRQAYVECRCRRRILCRHAIYTDKRVIMNFHKLLRNAEVNDLFVYNVKENKTKSQQKKIQMANILNLSQKFG